MHSSTENLSQWWARSRTPSSPPSATCTQSRGSGGQCRGEQRGGPGSGVLGVLGEFSCGSPPPSLVACPGGYLGQVWGTNYNPSLVWFPDSMAVRPAGKRANSCMLNVMAYGPDVTTDTCEKGWETIWDRFSFLSAAMWQPLAAYSEGKHSQTFSQPTVWLLASEYEESCWWGNLKCSIFKF